MNLSEVKPGQKIKIKSVPEAIELRLHSLGIKVGDFVACISRNFLGPVVLQKQKNFNQIAINHSYASSISVSET